MERIKTLGALLVIGILTSLLVACSGGGGPSQSDVLGVTAQNGNPDPGGSTGGDDKPSAHEDPGRGNGGDIQPGGSGGNDNNPKGSGSSGNNPGGTNDHGSGGGSGSSPGEIIASGNSPGGPADHSGGSNDRFDVPISSAFNSQQSPKMVYESDQGKFLVVWNDLRNRSSFDYEGWAVYGQFMNGTGVFEGENFPISPQGVEYRTSPIVAYDAATGRSLVVWGTTGGDVLGQMVNPDGTLDGDVILIAASSDYESVPALAFDPIQGRFLVAWLDSTHGYSIFGQLLGREGSLRGNPFLISGISSGKLELQAAANTDLGRFFVVWRDYRGVDIYSIYGQMVNDDGTLQGNEISIADASGSQIAPALAYDSVNRSFLVIWFDDRRYGAAHYEIYGQLVAADGLLMGPNFFISAYGGYSHSVAFEPTNPHYLITFSKYGNRIYGQYVAADGTVTDAPFTLSERDSEQGAPHLAYDSKNKKFLTAWTDHRNASADIYANAPAITASHDLCDGQNEDQGTLIDLRDPTVFSAAHNQPSFSTKVDGREFSLEARPEGATLWWDKETGLGVQYSYEQNEVEDDELLAVRFSPTQLLRKIFITEFFNEGYLEEGFYELNGSGEKVHFTASPDQLNGSTKGELTLSVNESVDSIAFSAPGNTKNAGESHEFSVAAIEILPETVNGCLKCEDAGKKVDEICPSGNSYTNHGDYIDCVTKQVRELRKDGVIGAKCALKLVDPRARSQVGR